MDALPPEVQDPPQSSQQEEIIRDDAPF